MFGKKKSEGAPKLKTVFLRGRCIHKYDPATVKLTEVGPRHKDTCSECGKRAYGALCTLETVKRSNK